MDQTIKKIVVVGGGSAGWMTATTLVKTFPNMEISVIEPADIPIVGVGESTIGGIMQWARYVGLDETKFFAQTDASYKLSIAFTDFYKKDSGRFQYPFGKPVFEPNRNPFHEWHLKKYYYPETPVQDMILSLFPSSALYESNKFSLNENGEFDQFNPKYDIAYHFDAVKFGQYLKNDICLPNGVTHIEGSVDEILTNESGVSSLTLKDGTSITADLYIDCTGWRSLLLGAALDEPFVSYSHILPNNRAVATHLSYKDKENELQGYTNCTAIENGWCWNIPLWSRIGTGYVYSDKFITKEQAIEEFKAYLMSNKMTVPRTQKEVDSLTFKDISMRIGIHQRTFVKNVVAIGLSAGFIEPLESNGLFSVHEFLMQLIDILQRREISQFDRDMYNVTVRDMFDGFAKFVALHYALSHRDDTDYWRSIRNTSFKDSYGDPYFPYKGRTDAFYDITHRYMKDWAHPPNIAGITYIATGMNLNMINRHREEIESAQTSKNIKEDITEISRLWDLKKSKWAKNASKSKTLYQYLKDTYYNKS
jgi:tryptophan halogenase